MKYTNSISCVAAVFLATLIGVAPSRAQSAYVSGAPSLSAYNTASATTEADARRYLDAAYVAALYRDLLLRDPDAGASIWIGQLDHGTPRSCVAARTT